MFTEEQIEALRPQFSFGGQIMFMVDWFKTDHCVINDKTIYYSIKSGLRHADGVTTSPYFYERTFFKEDAKEKALAHFSAWWVRIHKERDLS